jgi:hypothetical protein
MVGTYFFGADMKCEVPVRSPEEPKNYVSRLELYFLSVKYFSSACVSSIEWVMTSQSGMKPMSFQRFRSNFRYFGPEAGQRRRQGKHASSTMIPYEGLEFERDI